MAQPVFFIDKEVVIAIIKTVEAKGGYRYSGYSFGESSPDALIDLVMNLDADDEGHLKVAKVANAINSQETMKMPGNANVAINLIIKMINDNKVPKSVGGDQ